MSDWKARYNTDSGASPQCSKVCFSQSQHSVQALLRCPYSPCVQSHASTSVRTLKIPNTGSHTIVWTHKQLHTLIGMGSCALGAAVPYTGKPTWISCKRQWSTTPPPPLKQHTTHSVIKNMFCRSTHWFQHFPPAPLLLPFMHSCLLTRNTCTHECIHSHTRTHAHTHTHTHTHTEESNHWLKSISSFL